MQLAKEKLKSYKKKKKKKNCAGKSRSARV